MEWLTKLIDINRIPTKLVTLIFIISSLFLFLPEGALKILNLNPFKQEYHNYLGLSFITSLSFLVIGIFTWSIDRIKHKRLEKKSVFIIEKSLRNLDRHEKAVLREFAIQNRNTIKMPIDNPTVSGLLNKRIIVITSRNGESSNVGMLFNFTISEAANANLNSQILELPSSEFTNDDLNRIKNDRPDWIVKLESFQALFNV